MPDQTYPTQPPHPEPWGRDLNPDFLVGQNVGHAGGRAVEDAHTAFDLKGLHERLAGFDDDELRTIPILPRGTRLEQGATYIDLRDPDCHEFTATADMEAGPGSWIVPKKEVGYQFWNRLIGVRDPERLGLPSEP